ncbi:MAG: FliH/SctL family protein [Acidobacteriaceae bacterium]
MSMSPNCVGFDNVASVPVRTLVYHDMANPQSGVSADGYAYVEADGARVGGQRAEVELSQDEFARRIAQERGDAVRQMEQQLRGEYERKLACECTSIAAATSAFSAQRDQYFARAETEIVQLALAIAAKILHREAQVDPMLVATLVRMAVEKMREGSSVTVRVGRGQASRWKKYFSEENQDVKVEVVEDAALTDHDCIVETELGVANFGLDTQLKEVEQGFFDLMALRPGKA